MQQLLRIVVVHKPPFVFVEQAADSNQPTYRGMLIELLPMLLQRVNLASTRYTYYTSTSDVGGFQHANGTWSGIMGEVVSGRADLSLFPLTRTYDRALAVDMTYSYYDSGLSLLVVEDDLQPGPLSVLAPFSTSLWIWLIVTVFSVAFIFWVLDVYSLFWARRASGRQLRDAAAAGELAGNKALARKLRRKASRVKGSSHFMSSWQAAAGVPEPSKARGWSVQLLQICYCFFATIMVSAYTANLTSFLSSSNLQTEVTGLASLLQAGDILGVLAGGSTAAYFASSADAQATQLHPALVYCADTAACMDLLKSGSIGAFASDRPSLDYLAASAAHGCNLQVVGDPFGPGDLVVALQKNNTLTEALNHAMQYMIESGALTALQRKWFEESRACPDLSGSSESATARLGIGSLLGCFVFLAAGVGLAFIVAGIEVLVKRFKPPGMGQLIRSVSSAVKSSRRQRASRTASLGAAARLGQHAGGASTTQRHGCSGFLIQLQAGNTLAAQQPHEGSASVMQQCAGPMPAAEHHHASNASTAQPQLHAGKLLSGQLYAESVSAYMGSTMQHTGGTPVGSQS